MKTKLFITFILCMAAVALTPATHAETHGDKPTLQDVKKETRDLIETLKGYGAERHDEAMQKSREALATLDRHIDELETRIDRDWERMDQAARDKSRTTLRELRKQRAEVAEWFGRWKESSANAWEQMKKGFANAYQDLQEAREKAEKEFGGEK